MRHDDCSCGCGGSCGSSPAKVAVNVDGVRVMTVDSGAPSPLYVSRPLINSGEVVAWAKLVGLRDVVDDSDAHVTVAYSRSPVDWFELPTDYQGDLVVQAGGPRKLEVFGKPDSQVVVLRFKSLSLSYRWEELRQAGCSWDWPDYSPHVTLSKSVGSADLSRVAAFSGQLVFGPEVFAPLSH